VCPPPPNPRPGPAPGGPPTPPGAAGGPPNATVPQTLTRREVQCLRWAAAGKTDSEIGIILDVSVSTVRFHLRNAAAKLGATGRAQSIQLAAGLGYVGAGAA
ncbi:helix-turn-helix transcriptional regulator, partial [Novosphingobium sp.]|uniref:helix-turn-helix domain-containing protein n=1 Tax=Novosphingobium sp. TaxID=1874826 RepID=UPI0035B46D25